MDPTQSTAEQVSTSKSYSRITGLDSKEVMVVLKIINLLIVTNPLFAYPFKKATVKKRKKNKAACRSHFCKMHPTI